MNIDVSPLGPPAQAVEPGMYEDLGALAQISPGSAGDDLPGDFNVQMQSSLTALEKRFASFAQMLSRELNALERQFTSALRSLFKSVKQSGDQRPMHGVPPLACAPSRFAGIIERSASKHGVDPALVSAVIAQESGFQPDAVSSQGALGLMQLMPATAKELGVTNPFDAQQNIDGGTRLLRTLLDRYGGRLDFALAAYNAGPAAVDKYGGVPPFAETRSYVQSIMAAYRSAALAS